MRRDIAGRGAVTNDLAGVFDRQRLTVPATQRAKVPRCERVAWHRLIDLRHDHEHSMQVLVMVLSDRAELQDRVMSQDAQLRAMNIRRFHGGKWSQN